MGRGGGILRRESAILIIVDVQERLAAAMALRDRVAGRIRLLATAAAITGCPIVVTRQYPQGLGGLVDPVLDVIERTRAEGADVSTVDKVAFDCFAEPEFETHVDRLARRQMLIAGMESHICVAQTALSALERGFDVHVAADACCSRESDAHDLAVMRLSRAGAVATTAESAAYELVARAGTPEFKALLQAVKE